MRVLWLVDPDRDLGVDLLYDGFVALLGADNVIDWPPKALYHADAEGGAMAVFAYPSHPYDASAITDALAAGSIDLIVVTSGRPVVHSVLHLAHMAPGVPMITLDYGDHDQPLPPVPRTPVAEFSQDRNLERCHQMATGFPQRWARNLSERTAHVFWRGQPNGSRPATMHVFDDIPHAFGDYAEDYFDYLAQLGDSLVAWCPPGIRWDTHRLPEAMARGCAVLCPTPPTFVTDAPEAVCRYEGNEGLKAAAGALLSEPDIARALGDRAYAEFLIRHTTAHRARRVLALSGYSDVAR